MIFFGLPKIEPNLTLNVPHIYPDVPNACLSTGINMTINFLELKFAIFIVVIANVLMGLPLRAETIFPAISLFSILQMSVCIYIPKAVETIADAKVSIDRYISENAL